MRILPRKYAIASLSGFSAAGVAVATMVLPTAPANAIVVFDPSNYSQNILTAARSLQQINNQIRMLQNQAQSLINEAHNLTTIGFPEITTLQRTVERIDQLMGQAQGIQFHVANVDQQFRSLFPSSFDAAVTNDTHVADARSRLDTSVAAYKQTMSVQAQVVENIAADETTLNGIVARSQGAEGALQVSQATNQLLAMVAKQQFQIEHLMAAQYRANAIARANGDQAQIDAQGVTAKFLGSGNAYTPTGPVQ
jgi:P-type conjugative transfer protein TrbJ